MHRWWCVHQTKEQLVVEDKSPAQALELIGAEARGGVDMVS